MKTKRVVLIAGPTASGKSALALALAERLGRCVIVNADSMQVYRDLAVLTARPGGPDLARAPHALFGTVDGAEAYSAARYARDAAVVLADAAAADRVPIVVGGTGLYFKVLLEGLSPIPDIDPLIREQLRRQAAEAGAAAMHSLLAARDPLMAARLAPTDTQRITRALEVLSATGRSLADWQAEPGLPVIDARSAAGFVLELPRAALMQRCDERFDAMISAGALEEVIALHARGLSSELPLMRALGVRPLIGHLQGRLLLDAAAGQAKAETRQFAKRQTTWLKRHMISWNKLLAQETERNIDRIISIIDS